MNIKIMKLYVLSLLLLLASCGKKHEKHSKANAILKGNHELRRFKVATKDGYRWSAGYFILAGSAHGETYNSTDAAFSWKLNTGEYAISQININRIRVLIDNNVDIPYVKFNWSRSNTSHLQILMSDYVNYMVVVCKEEDYPVNINLNEL